jgi:uncharacterized protein YjiS (DUF1127 family)
MSITLHAFAGPAGSARQRPTALDLISLWRHRANSRRALATLDRHQLDDIGIAPDVALAEARRPFWRA